MYHDVQPSTCTDGRTLDCATVMWLQVSLPGAWVLPACLLDLQWQNLLRLGSYLTVLAVRTPEFLSRLPRRTDSEISVAVSPRVSTKLASPAPFLVAVSPRVSTMAGGCGGGFGPRRGLCQPRASRQGALATSSRSPLLFASPAPTSTPLHGPALLPRRSGVAGCA